MVKNTGGGKYAKKQASKHSNNTRAEELRKSQSPDEVYACVSQNFGNRLDVITIDGETLNCRMGGKFTGRKKRDNIVVKGSWVLVGLYDWEKETKKCELLCIYDKYNIDELRNLPGYNWKHLLNASKNNDDADDEDAADDATGFVFEDNGELKPTSKDLYDNVAVSSTIQFDEEVNFEDI